MASVVEVSQSKPRVSSVTLKLTSSEAMDLKEFIASWFKRNYPINYTTRIESNATYKAVNDALEGKAPADVIKVNSFV